MDEYDALGGRAGHAPLLRVRAAPLAGALRNRYIGANVDPGTLTQVLRHLENAYTWKMDTDIRHRTHTNTYQARTRCERTLWGADRGCWL